MTTKVCEHQDRDIAIAIAEARHAGKLLGIKKSEANELDIWTLMPVDLSKDEKAEWLRFHVKLLFRMGDVERRCSKCGHRATGDLLKCNAEETRRINKFIAEAMEPIEGLDF